MVLIHARQTLIHIKIKYLKMCLCSCTLVPVFMHVRVHVCSFKGLAASVSLLLSTLLECFMYTCMCVPVHVRCPSGC